MKLEGKEAPFVRQEKTPRRRPGRAPPPASPRSASAPRRPFLTPVHRQSFLEFLCRPMRSLAVALVFASTAHGASEPGWHEAKVKSPDGKLGSDVTAKALTFYRKLKQKLGRDLTVEEAKKDFAKWADDVPDVGGPDQISKLREFVKRVGPVLLDKREYMIDGPLNIVQDRVDEILGIEETADMKKHPYIRGRFQANLVKEFMRDVADFAHGWRRGKDEL